MVKAQTRYKNRPKPNKQKAARIARGEKQALESLAHKRRPFDALLKEIVAAVLYAESPTPRGGSSSDSSPEESANGEIWVEVGSGLGQLRALLPPEILSRVVHTDVSEWLVRGLVEKFPEARVATADVARLPFETGSVDVVLGLCAFDSFPDPVRASHEIVRVLREGGRFVHFLDAATNIEPVLSKLVATGFLPLPNFLADIALGRPDLLALDQVGHLIQPYHDVLSVPLAQFTAITEMLQRAGHPMTAMLHRYMAVFLKQPFEALPAARTFVELTSDPAVGRPMNQVLMSLFTTLQQPPYSEHMRFDLRSHASLAHFKATLERHFGPEFGCELRLSTVVYARSYEADEREPLRARVRRVGIGQNSVEWPAPLGVPTCRLKPDLPSPEPDGATVQTHLLREAAIYCLVAEKVVGGQREGSTTLDRQGELR